MKKTLIVIFLLCCIAAALAYYYYEKKEQNPQQLILYGNVDIRTVDLGFRVPGRIDKLFFEEGDLVKEGTPLTLLDPIPYENEVKRLQAQVEAIKINLANANILYDRREKLIQSHSVSKEERDDALSTRNQLAANLKQSQAELANALVALEDTRILAPSPGILLTRIREKGTIVAAGDPVYTLSLLDPIWVRAYIREADLGKIYPGMEAEITNDSEKRYKGRIGFISPVAEFTPKTVETVDLRTDLVYRLRIIVENTDYFLRQGMPVTVHIPLQPPHE